VANVLAYLLANGLEDNDIRRAVEEIEALHDFIAGELWWAVNGRYLREFYQFRL